MSHQRTCPQQVERKSSNVLSICDYSGQPSCLGVQLAGRHSPHQTQAAIVIIVIKNPVVIMGRHPADKSSVLQVEINSETGPQ